MSNASRFFRTESVDFCHAWSWVISVTCSTYKILRACLNLSGSAVLSFFFILVLIFSRLYPGVAAGMSTCLVVRNFWKQGVSNFTRFFILISYEVTDTHTECTLTSERCGTGRYHLSYFILRVGYTSYSFSVVGSSRFVLLPTVLLS